MAQLPQFKAPSFNFDIMGMLGQMGDLQKMQEQQNDQKALQEASQLFPDDEDGLLAELNRRGRGALALNVKKTIAETRESQAKALGSQLDNNLKRFSQGASIVSGIKDEPSFQRGKKQLAAMVGPDLAAQLGETYDPAVVEQALSWGTTETGRIQAQKNALDAAAEARKLDDAQKTPEAFQKWTEAYANAMSVAKNQEEWAAMREGARLFGVKPSILEMLPEQFRPDAPDVAASLAMSAKERADVKNAEGDDTRAASQFDTTSRETGRHNRAMEANAAQGATAPVAVKDPKTGQTIYARPQDAIGMQPGSNREMGRNVTSTDAERIGDLQTSLDDLAKMKTELQGIEGATGARAGFEAGWVPDAVTEATGWGTGPKQKQALIDRVRQVIGKALEGGVLRKEDEEKYKKILPVIGDPPDIVATKLQGLESALKQRIERTYETLQDAGYDVSKYRARQGANPKDINLVREAAPAGGGTVRLRAPNGQEQDVPEAEAAAYLARGAVRVR